VPLFSVFFEHEINRFDFTRSNRQNPITERDQTTFKPAYENKITPVLAAFTLKKPDIFTYFLALYVL